MYCVIVTFDGGKQTCGIFETMRALAKAFKKAASR